MRKAWVTQKNACGSRRDGVERFGVLVGDCRWGNEPSAGLYSISAGFGGAQVQPLWLIAVLAPAHFFPFGRMQPYLK